MAAEQNKALGRGEDSRALVEASLAARYRQERRFQIYGITAVTAAVAFVLFFFASIIGQGYTAFTSSYVNIDIYFDPEVIDPQGARDPEELRTANYQKLVRNALTEMFPGVSGRTAKRELNKLVSAGAAYELQAMVLEDPDIIGSRDSFWFLADDELDMFFNSAGGDRYHGRYRAR